MAVNQSQILRKAYIIASRGSQWAGDIILNDIEEIILEEALRSVGIPNLPSGGAPLAPLDGSRRMLLDAKVNNLTVELTGSRNVLIRQPSGEYIRSIAKVGPDGSINTQQAINDAASRKRVMDNQQIKHALEAYFFPIIDWGGSAYANTTPYSTVPSLATHSDKFSGSDFVKAETEITNYLREVQQKVPSLVKAAMERYWNITDKEMTLFPRQCPLSGTYRYVSSCHTEYKKVGPPITNTDGTPIKDGWKGVVFRREFESVYNREFQKWVDYYDMFHIRMNKPENKPWSWELQEQIQELKKNLENEKEKRIELEKKRDSLRAKMWEELI